MDGVLGTSVVYFQMVTHLQASFKFNVCHLYFKALNMSDFVPRKVYLRGILLHYFIQKNSVAEAHRFFVETYGDHALSETTCRDWFRRFKNYDFDVEDKERSGAPKTFEDEELEALLHAQAELPESLGVDHTTVSKRLKVLGIIQKQEHWVPYELKARYTTITLIVEGKPEHASTSAARTNIHSSKLLLCIWCDKLRIVYYELLKSTETNTGGRYRIQLVHLSRALKKRPLYEQRHNKVILLHDNARPHVAKRVKTYLETFKWKSYPTCRIHQPLPLRWHMAWLSGTFIKKKNGKKMGRFVVSLKKRVVLSTWNSNVATKMVKSSG